MGESWLDPYKLLALPSDLDKWAQFYNSNRVAAVDFQRLTDESFVALAITKEDGTVPIRRQARSRLKARIMLANRSPTIAITVSYKMWLQNGCMRFDDAVVGFLDHHTVYDKGKLFPCAPSLIPDRIKFNRCPGALMHPYQAGDEMVFCDIYPASGDEAPMCRLQVAFRLTFVHTAPVMRPSNATALAVSMLDSSPPVDAVQPLVMRPPTTPSSIELAASMPGKSLEGSPRRPSRPKMREFAKLRNRLAHYIRDTSILRGLDDLGLEHVTEKCEQIPGDADRWHKVIAHYVQQDPPALAALAEALKRFIESERLDQITAPDLHVAIAELVTSGILPGVN